MNDKYKYLVRFHKVLEKTWKTSIITLRFRIEVIEEEKVKRTGQKNSKYVIKTDRQKENACKSPNRKEIQQSIENGKKSLNGKGKKTRSKQRKGKKFKQ